LSGTYEEAKRLADLLHDAEIRASRLDALVQGTKLVMARARHDLEIQTSKFALHAQVEGTLDGRNAEGRKWQLDTLLEGDPVISDLGHMVKLHEDALGRAEQGAAELRAEAHWLRNLFNLELAAFSQPPMATADPLGQALDLAVSVEQDAVTEYVPEEDPF